jgi:hypothetical protein
MRKIDVDTILRATLGPGLREYGFLLSSGTLFIRTLCGPLQHEIALSTNKLKTGQIGLAAGANVTAESLRPLLAVFSDVNTASLIGAPLRILSNSKLPGEWLVESERSLRTVIPILLQGLVSYAIPFLDRYSSFRDLLHDLSTGELQKTAIVPHDWQQLLPILITFAQGDRQSAMRSAQAELERNRRKKLMYWLPWKKLVDYMEQHVSPQHPIE